MTLPTALTAAVKKIFEDRGGKALEKTRNEIMLNFKDDSYICETLRYFAEVTLRNALPVFPALVSISCAAVGGDPEEASSFGMGILLIAGAADLHDDVIDKSFLKNNKRTALGKFGENATILAGDILLVQGITRLYGASGAVSKKQHEEIMSLVADAVLQISSAETLETQLRGRLDLPPDELHEVIRRKAVVPELTMRIGAILGNGDSRSVDRMGEFGRTYGILSTMLDEFNDLLEINEFQSRLEHECPPLPFLCAMQNPLVRTELLQLLKNKRTTRKNYEKVVVAVLGSREVEGLKKELTGLVNEELRRIQAVPNMKARNELELLLSASLECLQTIGAS